MKIASSSASFAREIDRGDLTQLEWLDLCANELELDGIVFDIAQFPRLDAEYLAHAKKVTTDLGLSVAGLSIAGAFDVDAADAAGAASSATERALEVALALGAPLLIVGAPHAAEDANAWGAFTDAVKTLAGEAKRANVTLALRNAADTLCATTADLRRTAKDVDSAWLRFALDAGSLGTADDSDGVLPKTAIATFAVADPETFATAGDRDARDLIERLRRFRGFVSIDATGERTPTAFHDALERFAVLRAAALFPSASASP
jgi:sugar phosphate isomerase/epimerase